MAANTLNAGSPAWSGANPEILHRHRVIKTHAEADEGASIGPPDRTCDDRVPGYMHDGVRRLSAVHVRG
ncbi:hypothetical protein ACWEO2_40880 [Nocardia sp. NPDC004278]